MSQFADDQPRFIDGLSALRAAGEMRFKSGTLFRIERAKGVALYHLPKLVLVAHERACNSSFSFSKALRIQLFTVPSGSFSAAAISEWLRPAK